MGKNKRARTLVKLAVLGPLMYVVLVAVMAVVPHLPLPVYTVDPEGRLFGDDVLIMGLGLAWILDGAGRGVRAGRSIHHDAGARRRRSTEEEFPGYLLPGTAPEVS